MLHYTASSIITHIGVTLYSLWYHHTCRSDDKNLFHKKFYFVPLHVSSTFIHHQEVKFTLQSLWYHHTYRFIGVMIQDLFHNKFYFTPLHVSSTCVQHQEVKIALHSLWYHHTVTSEWSEITKILVITKIYLTI